MLQSLFARYSRSRYWIQRTDSKKLIDYWVKKLGLVLLSLLAIATSINALSNKDSPSLIEAVHTPLTSQIAHIDVCSSVVSQHSVDKGITPNSCSPMHKGKGLHLCICLSMSSTETLRSHPCLICSGISTQPCQKNQQILPFWVCPSSMSSSIVLMLFLEQREMCEKCLFGLQVQTLFIFKG